MSYDRMKTEEIRLNQEIAKLLADAEANDKAEDIELGPDRHGDELPGELARRQSRLAKVLAARKLLEERARTAAAEEAAHRQAEGKPPAKTPPAEAASEPKDQINFTDPQSRIMKASNKDWDQCGNAQAVCNEHQVILAADVTDQVNDVRQVVPMIDQTRANLDAAGVKGAIQAALGDADYLGHRRQPPVRRPRDDARSSVPDDAVLDRLAGNNCTYSSAMGITHIV